MGSDPVRVLWLIKGLGPGGAERLLVNQALAHDPAAVAPRVAYLVPWKTELVPELEDAGIPVNPLDGPREWDLRWALRLRRHLLADPVEVVHVHSPYVAAIARLVVRSLPLHRRPALLYTEHNRWPRHSALTRTANRITLGLDDHDLAVSDDVRATMPARARGRVEVLVHGVDLDTVCAHLPERDAMRSELGFSPDDVVIGIVANFRREKAYEVLLTAAAAATQREDRLRFVSVGQGPLEAEMRARCTSLGLDERFSILGYRSDPLRVMSALDVFTLSSRHEGLPVSLMEALALGLPVVATHVGGIPQAVTDGIEGRLVPPDRPAALADAYVEIADDRLRAELAEAARAAGSRLGIDAAERRLEQLYRELAASRRS